MKPRSIVLLFAVACALPLAACGGGAAAAPKATPTADPQKAMLEFAQCMREHGVDMPDPGVTRGPIMNNTDPATEQAAESACRSKLKGAGPSTLSPAQQAQLQDQLVKFTKCMRAHGVNLPDPKIDSGGGGAIRIGGPGSDFDPTSAEFQAAQKACQQYMAITQGGPVGNRGGQ